LHTLKGIRDWVIAAPNEGEKEMVASAQLAVEIFPAGVGDAILARCWAGGRRVNILVDGGVRKTYESHLADRLRALRAGGERLDLLVVTHIDTDHIGGILKLLKENGSAAVPAVIEIGDIWHNGYRHLGLQGRRPEDEEKRKVLAQVAGADETRSPTGDISVREGDTLAKLIVGGGYAWNRAWGGNAAVSGSRTTLAPGVEITVLSPARQNLDKLAYQWRKALLTMGVSYEAVDCPEFEEAFEKAAALPDAEASAGLTPISATVGYEPPDPSTFVEDTSMTNGSSIAFLLEFAGIRALFLGDSWPGVVADAWGKLPPDVRERGVELMKVSHHGSQHNTSPTLLELIAAQQYAVSTDGSKHGHPDIETLLWIADRRRDGATLVFNYPSGSSGRIDHPDAKARFGHKVLIGDGKEPVTLTFDGEVVHGAAAG
jgi:hypothetical protein